jgi:anti-sigma B factor antagonist
MQTPELRDLSGTSDLRIAILEPGAVLSLSGRLSARTVADVRAALVDAIGSGAGDLLVDIADLQLVDGSGLGVLVAAHRLALRSERRLVLRAVPPRVDRLLAVTHLNRVIAVEPATSTATEVVLQSTFG